jgi:hypothetical protein
VDLTGLEYDPVADFFELEDEFLGFRNYRFSSSATIFLSSGYGDPSMLGMAK